MNLILDPPFSCLCLVANPFIPFIGHLIVPYRLAHKTALKDSPPPRTYEKKKWLEKARFPKPGLCCRCCCYSCRRQRFEALLFFNLFFFSLFFFTSKSESHTGETAASKKQKKELREERRERSFGLFFFSPGTHTTTLSHTRERPADRSCLHREKTC